MKQALICNDTDTGNIIVLAIDESNQLADQLLSYTQIIKKELKLIDVSNIDIETLIYNQSSINETFRKEFD